MNDNNEIKYEFLLNGNLCPVCLSVGRTMYLLGQYKTLFEYLAFQNVKPVMIDVVKLCWECMAVLRKVRYFQELAAKATKLLDLDQVQIYGTLSSLTSIVINDTHPHTVYVNENTLAHVHVETVCNDDNENVLNDDIEDNVSNDDHLIKNDDDTKNTDMALQVIKKTKPSRWAAKRASQNKKKKFAIVANKKYGNFFKSVRIANEELRGRFMNERNSEDFKSKRYKCLDCVQVFLNARILKMHNEAIHSKKNGNFICDICSTRLKKKSKMAEHLNCHYLKYECNLCDFKCYDKSQARSHFQKSHKKIFQCVKCKLMYGTRKEFYHHYKSHHEKFICDHCGVSFKMKYCIKDHLRKKHSPHECRTCGKRFARYNGLWVHKKTRHAGPTSGAYCVECDRHYADVFRYRWHLANSVRHTPRKKVRIPCPGCEKTFTKKIYMKDHYDLVHLKNYKYRCEQCDKNFVRNAELTQHTRRVHEGVLPPRNKICYVCGRGFTTNRVLANHVRTHSGSRPFACTTCDARFTQRTALASHAKAVHRAKAD